MVITSSKLEKILNKLDPKAYVLENRLNSNFQAEMITNLRYDVTKLNHEMGAQTELAAYILSNHRYIKSFQWNAKQMISEQ